MHILICGLHRPNKPTGVCRHTANLARCLVDTDIVNQVTLVIGSWQKEYFKNSFNLISPKINLIDIDIKNTSLSRNFWYLWGLPKLAKIVNPDLIHLSFPLPFIRSWFPIPVVSTIHDLYAYEHPENFGYPQVLFNQLFFWQCVKNSDALTCVSKCTLKQLKYYFPSIISHKLMSVVYNYVDFDNVQPIAPKFIDTNSTFILTVGQHRKNKNLDLLIFSYQLLLQQQEIPENSLLVIVGSYGPETEKLLGLIDKLDLIDNVLMIAAIRDQELYWLYQHCQLFIIPSIAEGFCIPLIEALQLSPRVICSDIPVFREIAGNHGEYFQLGNEKQSILNIYEIVAKSLKDKKIINFTPLSKHNIASSYLDVYASLSH